MASATDRLSIPLVVLASLLSALVFAAVLTGVLPDFADGEARPKDWWLVASALGNAVLGAAIALFQVCAGSVLSKLLRVAPDDSVANHILYGFPLSLLMTALLCVAALALPGGEALAIVSVGGIGGAFFTLFMRGRSLLDGMGPAVLLIVPLALAFGAWIGVVNHGPTGTLTAWPHPDAAFYAGNILPLSATPFPLRNFGFEGETISLFNMLVPLTGAVLWRFFEFDTFLFINAGGGAIFLVWTAIALRAFVLAGRRAGTGPFPTPFGLLSITLGLLTVPLYPSWICDSIPMIYLAPLTISIVHIVLSGRSIYAGAYAIGGAVAGALLSKVTAGAFLVPFTLAAMLSRALGAHWKVRVLFFGLAGVSGLVALVMLAIHIPNLAHFGDVAPTSWTWYRLGYSGFVPLLLRDLGGVTLAVAALVYRQSLTGLAIAAACLAGVFYSLAFFAALSAAALALALLLSREKHAGPAGFLALAGFALSLPKAVLGDPAGAWIAVPWCLAICSAVVLMAAPATMTGRRRVAVWLAPALALGLGLAAIGTGTLRMKSGYWYPVASYEGLTPDVRDIWDAVRHRTPPDALVFTDQTGDRPRLLEGWNTYAFHGQRQVYISQYIQTFRARLDPEVLQTALATNRSVLDGTLSPAALPYSRRYSAYYFVISRRSSYPDNWDIIHQNGRYVLAQWRPPGQ